MTVITETTEMEKDMSEKKSEEELNERAKVGFAFYSEVYDLVVKYQQNGLSGEDIIRNLVPIYMGMLPLEEDEAEAISQAHNLLMFFSNLLLTGVKQEVQRQNGN